MAVNLTQNSDGTTTFVSSVNSKIPFIMHEERGAYRNIKQYRAPLMDDFDGDALDARWSGATSSGTAPAVNVQAGGVCRLVTGSSAGNISSLTHELNWKPSAGGLYMACRFKPITSVAAVCYNIGFTDTTATTTVEMPITISGTTLTTNTTDGALFVYDTDQTNDYFHCQGVATNVDTAISNTSIGPSADTYVDLEVAIDSSGTATFYINSVLVATVASAVTPTVSLTPVIAIDTRTAATKTCDVDYVFVTGLRA